IFNNVILGACFGVFLFFGRNKITQLQALIFFICGDPSAFRPWEAMGVHERPWGIFSGLKPPTTGCL
ncbi:hypothetical protein, partial [Aliiglaciecola aliphaticivorans]